MTSTQAPFASYGQGGPAAEPRFALFGDIAHGRAVLAAAIKAVGAQLAVEGPLAQLSDDPGLVAGLDHVVLLVTEADAASLTALAAAADACSPARTGLTIETRGAVLDPVFGIAAGPGVAILADPLPAERLLALVEAAGARPGAVRDLGEEDRLALLRLAEQVARIAERLDRIAPAGGVASPALRFAPPEPDSSIAYVDPEAAPPPDPREVRRHIRHRRLRARYFDAALFADPAWDILLDLTAAQAEGARVSVTSLCIAAAVPPTTALRWIRELTDLGLLVREADPRDRRRAFVHLSPASWRGVCAWWAAVEQDLQA